MTRRFFLLLILTLIAACARRERPDVLLVTFDTARADAFGAYGSTSGATPAVDALAREGVVFEDASTTVPLTLPAHTSLLTGTFPPYHSVRENGTHAAPEELITLAEVFRQGGYRTGAFVGAFVLDARWGLDQGFDTYSGSFDTTSADVFSLADLQRTADRVANDALQWLGEPSEKPFFAWVHFYDPHSPYEPPAPLRAKYSDPYAGEIAFADSQLARLLQKVGKETIVVVAADHGEGFGEHGENGHGLLLYEESLRVPLILRASGSVKPRRVPTPVSLADVFPTIAQLAGLEVPRSVQGHSLVPLARGQETHATPIYAETLYPRSRFHWSALRVLRNGPLKLIDSSDPELYDLASDGAERNDLAERREDLLRRNLHRLNQTKETLGQGAVTARASNVDAEARARLAALGYITGTSASSDRDDRSLPSPRTKMQSFNELTRARGDLASGDFVEAESRLLALAKSEPSMLEVHVALGELYLRSRRPENSVAAFRRALALSAADPSIISALATAELQAGRPQEALDLLGVAMSTSAEEPRFHFVAGRAWLAKSDLPAARREFEALLRLNPRAAAAMVELAGIAIAEKNAEEAKRWAGKALAIDPRARGARLFLAQALEESGDREAAWRMALAERENSPDDFRTAFYLAELAARRGEDAAIEPYLRATIELEPRFVTAYLTLARHLLRRGGDAADGVRLTQRAMELGLSDRDRALAHFLLADFYNRLGREDLSRRNAVLGRRFAASK